MGVSTASAAETDDFSVSARAAGESVSLSSWFVRPVDDIEYGFSGGTIPAVIPSHTVWPVSNRVNVISYSSLSSEAYIHNPDFSFDLFCSNSVSPLDSVSFSGSLGVFLQAYGSAGTKNWDIYPIGCSLYAFTADGEYKLTDFSLSSGTVSFPSVSYVVPPDCYSISVRFYFSSSSSSAILDIGKLPLPRGSGGCRVSLIFSSLPSVSAVCSASC